MKIPKNIATMTDDEHYAWIATLSDEQHSRLSRKTYRLVEWIVSTVDEDGDIIETEAHLSRAQAEQAYAAAEAPAVVLERLVNHYSVLVRDLEDREYKTIAKRGDDCALDCGGF